MVEVWLQRLVDGMQGTVKNIIKRASRNVQEMRLEDFIFSHPAQIALLGIQFQWTADTQVLFPALKHAMSCLADSGLAGLPKIESGCQQEGHARLWDQQLSFNHYFLDICYSC